LLKPAIQHGELEHESNHVRLKATVDVIFDELAQAFDVLTNVY